MWLAMRFPGFTGCGQAQVRNKSANPNQITAEQLLREARTGLISSFKEDIGVFRKVLGSL